MPEAGENQKQNQKQSRIPKLNLKIRSNMDSK
jgi:hypothetical protein